MVTHVSPLPEQISQASVKIICKNFPETPTNQTDADSTPTEVPLTTKQFKDKFDLKKAEQELSANKYSEILIATDLSASETQQKASPPQPPSGAAAAATMPEKHVVQGLDSNLFVVKGSTLYTAPSAKEISDTARCARRSDQYAS